MRQAQFTLLASLLAASLAHGQPVTTLTQAGYTGLGLTPNALLLGWGRGEFAYDHQLPGVVRNPSGHNFVLGFGVLPYLEASGRLATSTINNNCFTEGCGTRDLSASAKIGFGLDPGYHWRIAAGATDIGGAATNFRTYYGVLTYSEGPYEASAGLARRSNSAAGGNRSPLDGPFASAAWQPLPWVRGHLEYTDGNGWAGLKLFAPAVWLPEGWQAYAGTNVRLNDNKLTQRSWWTAGLSIPLYKVPALPGAGPKTPLPPVTGNRLPQPVYEPRVPAPVVAAAPSSAPAPVPPPPAAAPAPATPTAPAPATASAAVASDAKLQSLAAALQAKGLEDISVGRMPDGTIAVRANNASYNWNAADAVGAALGSVARTLGDGRTGYRLILTQRQQPLVAVTGQADCLRQWIASDADACAGGQLSTPGTEDMEKLHAGAAWFIRNQQPSTSTLRVALSPVLRKRIGTEFGAFDMSAGLNVGLLLPLWDGASVEYRRDVPVAKTSDYEAGGVFGFERVRNETERLVFVQTLRVPLERCATAGNDVKAQRYGLYGLTGQATVGRVGSSFDGVLGELRWEPGEGRHRLTGEAGYFHNTRYGEFNAGPEYAKPLLASYRYSVLPTRTYLEATAGQFMRNDAGFQLGLRQWFSDFSVGAYYRRTRLSGDSNRQFLGVEISLPIGPRRDMNPANHLQVTGTPRFAVREETLIRERINAVIPGFGVMPPAPSLDETFNSDRAGLVYFEDNIKRIRDAAR